MQGLCCLHPAAALLEAVPGSVAGPAAPGVGLLLRWKGVVLGKGLVRWVLRRVLLLRMSLTAWC